MELYQYFLEAMLPKFWTIEQIYEYGVTINDLHGGIRLIADEIGLDATLKLMLVFGGETIYLSKKESLIRSKRNREIKKNFNGKNYKELAVKYNLTLTHIRHIINAE